MARKKEPVEGTAHKRAEEDVEGHRGLKRTPEAAPKRAPEEDVEGHRVIAKKAVHRATAEDDVEGHGAFKRWPAEGITSTGSRARASPPTGSRATEGHDIEGRRSHER